MDEIEALFKKVMKPKPKKEDPLVATFKEVVKREKTKAKEKKGYMSNGYQYKKVWTEDGVGYRFVPMARWILEKKIGRPLQPDEKAYFINRKLKGDAKYHPDNIILGHTDGIPLNEMVCRHCGTKGQWELDSEPSVEPL